MSKVQAGSTLTLDYEDSQIAAVVSHTSRAAIRTTVLHRKRIPTAAVLLGLTIIGIVMLEQMVGEITILTALTVIGITRTATVLAKNPHTKSLRKIV